MDHLIDYGTPDRYRHGCVTVEGQDGKALDPEGMRVTRAKETHECLLDWLHDKRLLADVGESLETAERRLNAGLWLRECYHRAGLTPSGAANYQQKGAEFSYSVSSSMSEAESWNRKCLNETLRALPKYAGLLQSVCLYDETPKPGFFAKLRTGLDRLADLRGM